MKEIKVKVYDFKILDKVYNVYVHEKDSLLDFYLQEKGYGFIDFMIGLSNINIDEAKFIKENLIEWIYFYNENLGKLEEE